MTHAGVTDEGMARNVLQEIMGLQRDSNQRCQFLFNDSDTCLEIR